MTGRRWSRPSILPEERRALDAAVRGGVPVRMFAALDAENVTWRVRWPDTARTWWYDVRDALARRLAGLAGGAEW